MKNHLLYCCLLFVCICLNAQSFGQIFGPERIVYEAPAAGVKYADLADIDGDGDVDIVTASSSSSAEFGWLSVIENLGGGNFAPMTRLEEETSYINKVVSTDLDGDGDLDLLTAHFTGGQVKWYENLGGLNFSAPVVIDGSIANCRDAVAADVDGDGDEDVFACSHFLDVIYFYENLGGGNFASRVTVSTAVDAPYDLHLADVDGDGDADLLSASYLDDKVAWYENLGGGSFGPQQLISSTANGAESIGTADFDGDGDLDLAVGAGLDNALLWYENLGGAAFSPASILYDAPPFVHYGVDNIYIADVDGDGKPDILTEIFEGTAAWFRNLGGGAFDTERTFESGGIEVNALHVVAEDFDMDGDSDVIGLGYDRVTYLENLTGINFAPQVLLTAQGNYQVATVCADFDNDGDADVVGGIREPAMLLWYEQNGGELLAPELITLLPMEISLMRSADFDADGDIDIVLLSQDLAIHWFENLGAGSFGSPIFLGNVGQENLEVADMNQDGLPDIVAGRTQWITNLGGGSFGAVLTLGPSAYFADDFYPVDLDNDGILDLLAGHSDAIVWSKGLGGGNFSFRSTINTMAFGVTEVIAADLDGDGDMDPAATLDFGDRVTWYKNLGGGSFGSQRLISSPVSPRNLLAADLDQDGDIDVVTEEFGARLYFYENLGDGSFDAAELVFDISGFSDSRFHFADTDDDGDLDIVVGKYYSLWIVENLTIDCDPSTAVSGLAAVVGPGTVTLSWDAVPGSLGCQLNGRRTAPTLGPVLSRSLTGASLSSVSFPSSVLGTGTSWEARVRCLCVAPDIATPFSETVDFSVPLLDATDRFGEGSSAAEKLSTLVEISPNPVSDFLFVEYSGEGPTTIQVFDGLGRSVGTYAIEGPGNRSIDLSAVSAGQYFYQIQVNGVVSESGAFLKE